MNSTQFVVKIRAFRKLIHDNCTEMVEQGLLVHGVFHFGNFGKVVELKSFTLSKKRCNHIHEKPKCVCKKKRNVVRNTEAGHQVLPLFH